MKSLITGAHGFLGWHLQLAMHAQGLLAPVCVPRQQWPRLPHLLRDCGTVFHLAGVNRGSNSEVRQGNVALARELAAAIQAQPVPPRRVVYANSIQSGNSTPYGEGKAEAGAILHQVCEEVGSDFREVLLPNLFGEHGRPHYNSFVATFCHEVAGGRQPHVVDKPVNLLHVHDASTALLQAARGDEPDDLDRLHSTTVAHVAETLGTIRHFYSRGEIPPLEGVFATRLFNAYRSSLFPRQCPILLTRHADERGSLVETVRSYTPQGQTFVSSTEPGITRGDHFHLRKFERFVVVAGEATIRLRKMFTKDVLEIPVSGKVPVAIDMPVGWVHNITNTGTQPLITQFWTNEVFNPDDTDTYAEHVAVREIAEVSA